jgi:hypothetical protein
MSESSFRPIALGDTSDNSNGAYDQLLGNEYVFDNPNGVGVNTYKLVENSSLIALAPKRTVVYASGEIGKKVDGYVTTLAAVGAGGVDDQLPSTGVPAGYVFYILVKGQGLFSTTLAADAGALLPADTTLVAATAVTSQATTAGRVRAADHVLTEAALAAQINNSFGRAISAKTTANTGVDILCRVNFK